VGTGLGVGAGRVGLGDGRGPVGLGDGDGPVRVGDGDGPVLVGLGDGPVRVGDGDGPVLVGLGEGRVLVGLGNGFVGDGLVEGLGGGLGVVQPGHCDDIVVQGHRPVAGQRPADNSVAQPLPDSDQPGPLPADCIPWPPQTGLVDSSGRRQGHRHTHGTHLPARLAGPVRRLTPRSFFRSVHIPAPSAPSGAAREPLPCMAGRTPPYSATPPATAACGCQPTPCTSCPVYPSAAQS
jgi:hypothetical protein